LFTRAGSLSLFRTGVRIPDLKLSGDLYGLAAEHLEWSGSYLSALTKVFNEILASSKSCNCSLEQVLCLFLGQVLEFLI
jgi:hypothetical protein